MKVSFIIQMKFSLGYEVLQPNVNGLDVACHIAKLTAKQLERITVGE